MLRDQKCDVCALQQHGRAERLTVSCRREIKLILMTDDVAVLSSSSSSSRVFCLVDLLITTFISTQAQLRVQSVLVHLNARKSSNLMFSCSVV